MITDIQFIESLSFLYRWIIHHGNLNLLTANQKVLSSKFPFLLFFACLFMIINASTRTRPVFLSLIRFPAKNRGICTVSQQKSIVLQNRRRNAIHRTAFPDNGSPENCLSMFLRSQNQGIPINEFQLISAIKSCSLLSAIDQGKQIHSLLLKSGFGSNLFVHNSLINLYGKCGEIEIARILFDSALELDLASWNTMIVAYVKLGRSGDAYKLFDEMPERDCVSFTTMIMGFAQNDRPDEAQSIFREMQIANVDPNEVTMSSLISACSNLQAIREGRTIHGFVAKNGLQSFVIVSTNLVHMYSVSSSLDDAHQLFDEIPQRNVVTWNVMLNAYVKSGRVDIARQLFDKIPQRDLVSWSTMIDGYLEAERFNEALLIYRGMQRTELRPNEVTLVDFLSSCAHSSAIHEGRQFHGIILKSGFDSHVFVQTTIIHFYAACQQIDLACLQFQGSKKESISPWNALIAGFVRNDMLESACQVFDKMPERDVFSWSSTIAGYTQSGQFDSAIQHFREMQARGIPPSDVTMVSILSAIANSGELTQGRCVHSYIIKSTITINDNLTAGLIDMYAKCGIINSALKVFYHLRDKSISVSPWTAMIVGLAMHGHADKSLSIFADLQKTKIKPSSITFIGVLSACCHAGLVDIGLQCFEAMKSMYQIEPNIKHYGCVIDLLGRAGHLEEAERWILSMPMKADVVIWGSLLAACRTHGNVEMAERAAKNLSQLDPKHGGGRVLLSNIYAEARRWNDLCQMRRMMQTMGMKKLPGHSALV